MGSKLKGTGVEFPDGTLQTTAAFGSSISTMEIFYASGNFVKPVGVSRIEVTLVGGGAAAGPLSWMSSDTYISIGSDGYAEFYGSDTSITILGTEHKARGGWIRNDFAHGYAVELSEFQKYGGQAGYLGENGFAGSSLWKGASTSVVGNFSSTPDEHYPTAIGGSGYGYDGGSLKDFVDNFDGTSPSNSYHPNWDNWMKRNANYLGWAGGSGGYTYVYGASTTSYGGGNGGGSYFGSLGGSTPPLSAGGGTVQAGWGYVGGGGGALTVSGTVGGGGGGAGAGGGGVYAAYNHPLYGGAAGKVVTFHRDFNSTQTNQQITCPIVIGVGGDGLVRGSVAGGAGGQGVVIIKY